MRYSEIQRGIYLKEIPSINNGNDWSFELLNLWKESKIFLVYLIR